jgi:hypothetical protein
MHSVAYCLLPVPSQNLTHGWNRGSPNERLGITKLA